jgi:hypothetical protein
MASYPHVGSHKGGSGYSSDHRSSIRITLGGSSQHKIRVYENNDEISPSYSEMRDRDRRRSTSAEDKYYTSSSANRSSHRTASYRESLPSHGSSSRRDDYRAYDVSSLREALPSYGTTSYRDDYKKHDRSSSRGESLPTRNQDCFYDKYSKAKPSQSRYDYYDENDGYPTESKARQSKYYDGVNDYPTKSKSRLSKYEYYDEVDDYPKSSKSRQSKYHDEVDDYPTTSKSRHSKYEYYDEVDDYPTTSKSNRSKNDYYDGVDDYPRSSKSRQAKYYDEVDDYPSTSSTSNRREDPSWREEVSANGYDKEPVNVTSSKSRVTSQSEFLRRTFDCADAEGTVEAFMQRDENDEPDVVSGTFSFKRKRR